MNEFFQNVVGRMRSSLADMGDVLKGGAPNSNPVGQAAWNTQKARHEFLHAPLEHAGVGDPMSAVMNGGRKMFTMGKSMLTTRGGQIGLGLGLAGIGAAVGTAHFLHAHRDGEGLEHSAKKGVAYGLGADAAMYAAVNGTKASASMVGGLAMGVAGTAISAARGAEFGARALLTGSFSNLGHMNRAPFANAYQRGSVIQSPLDAWMPNMRNTPLTNAEGHFNPEKFALNPRVIRRLVGISAAGAAAGAALGAITPKAAPVSAYYDGTTMRRVGDLGAHAGYADQIRGGQDFDFSSMRAGLVHLL